MARRRLGAVLGLLAALAPAVLAAAVVAAPAARATAWWEREGFRSAAVRTPEAAYWTAARAEAAVDRAVVLPALTRTGVVTTTASIARIGLAGDTPGASWTAGGPVSRTVGKVFFTMAGRDYVCSANVVTDTASDRSIVVTAAHCLMDEETGRFATSWVFVPGWDAAPHDRRRPVCEQAPYGCWTAAALLAHGQYARAGSFSEVAAQHDWGFVVLKAGGRSNTLVERVVGSQEITFTNPAARTVSAFGYPAAPPFTGDDLRWCRGRRGGDPDLPGELGLVCDMTGGSSGGPWLAYLTRAGTGVQVSVNSYGYDGLKAMFGPPFTNRTSDTYKAALVATGNRVVG